LASLLCIRCSHHTAIFAGIGWSEESVLKKEIQIVDALHPTGTGILEYEVGVLIEAVHE